MADDRPDPDLYERDFYAWTQIQAQALREATGLSNGVDIDRVAEEIEDLGSEQRNAVRSHLLQIIIHLLKLETSRARDARNGWRREIRNHRHEIAFRLTKTIRRSLLKDLDELHRAGARAAQQSVDDYELDLTVDRERRWTLEQLLGEADDPLDTLR